MPYALKTTGIPAAPGITVKALLMVNEAGDAVIDLAGNSITPHAEVTIGTGSWNSTARKHFTTTGAGTTPKGVKWNTPFPDCNWDSSAGCSVYVALESINAGNGGESGRRWIRWENAGVTAGLDLRLEDGTTNQVELIRDSGSVAKATSGSRSSAKGSIALRANQSTAGSIRQAAHGSALADVTGSTTPGFLVAGTSKLKQFGGLDTAGWISTTVYCVLVVEGALSNAQLSALHTDWFAELVDVPPASMTGNVQLDDAAPTGNLASLQPSSLTGNVQLADAAPTGTLGAQFSSVRTLPASRNPGNGGRLTSIAGVALAVLSDDANLSRLAGTSSLDMGSDGRLYFANGIPVPIGTSVAVVTRLPGANGALGIERYVTVA